MMAVAVSVIAMLVVAGGVILVKSGHGSPAEIAQAADAVVVPETPISLPVAATTIPKMTDFASPDQPTAVGVREMTFTDLTRSTLARGDREALSTRPLTITVRYPTPGMPSQDEIPDAPVYDPAPLILFAHGFDISSDRYASLLHDLAADGFVVAAPEFPMSSTVFGGAPDEYDVPDQARDLSFLIAAMTGPDAPVSLAEMIAPGPVGVIGHSDGAVTALLAAYAPRYADSRIGAVVAVSGDFDTFGGEWFTTNDPPLLAIHGEYDEINPFESSQLLVGNDPGPAMLVGVQGQSHLGSVTDSQVVPAVARLIAFNFRWRLNGLPDAQAATIETASTPPLEFVASHD
jgi:predicted dienelactone hydrolase